MRSLIYSIWYHGHPLGWVLRPLELLYCAVITIRAFGYRCGWFNSTRLSVPVIIVGNITVGGSGKTPLVSWIAQFLIAQGWKPGIISRGYGGNTRNLPRIVANNDDPYQVGDEPLLLRRQIPAPVAIGKLRASAGQLLIDKCGCNCLIADDGLQHYALRRDVEIVVTDRMRGLGNQHCLPAGPLREPQRRLNQIALRVAHGKPEIHEHLMQLIPGDAFLLADENITRPLDSFRATPIHAVAGIGDPMRFFLMLRAVGLNIIPHPFPDHYTFRPTDLIFNDTFPVLMTEKDAVKCTSWNKTNNQWCVPVKVKIDPEFQIRLGKLLEKFA